MRKQKPIHGAGPPGKPLLPLEAEVEILEKLGADLRIGSGEIAAILKKHGVEADVERLQDSYRKRLGQRLMASIRDEEGRREVLARGSEYIVVECCSDQQALKAIRHRRVMVLTAAKETTPQHKPPHPHKYRRGVER